MGQGAHVLGAGHVTTAQHSAGSLAVSTEYWTNLAQAAGAFVSISTVRVTRSRIGEWDMSAEMVGVRTNVGAVYLQ